MTLKEAGRLGAKRLHELYDMKGANNPNWKGGISKNYYHYKLISKKRYPEKFKAREILYSALISGKIIRKPCEVCGDQVGHAHHEDYSKPLDVIWLCRKHHRERHGNLH